MTLKNTFGEYSFVSKIDVTDLEASLVLLAPLL